MGLPLLGGIYIIESEPCRTSEKGSKLSLQARSALSSSHFGSSHIGSRLRKAPQLQFRILHHLPSSLFLEGECILTDELLVIFDKTLLSGFVAILTFFAVCS